MSSQHTTHFPAPAMPSGDGKTANPEQPVVLVAFAKLVLMTGALVLFMPFWLDVLQDLVAGSPPQAWGALRVVVVGGAAAIVLLAVLSLKVWAGLIKHLARAD